VRQAANLWQLQATIQRRLVQMSWHATDPVPVIDTLRSPSVPTRVVGGGTTVFLDKLIMATVPRNRCITMASNLACASRAVA
jgi:hypothetical protein